MAAYPTLPWGRNNTKISREGGFQPVRATNGALKVRKLYSTEKKQWDIEHWLTDAQKATLETFYQANKVLNITVTTPDDGATYTARFATAPTYTAQVSYWVTTVKLMEV